MIREPQWTTRITNTDVKGEDHLGLEGVAQSYQQYLLPGIISTTDHARYYSFYCWALYQYINDPESPRTLAGFKNKYFKLLELAFIAGCFAHHKDVAILVGLVGGGINNYKARRTWESGDPIDLSAHLDYFGNALGGFGQYYRPVMETMELVAEAERPRLVYRLTTRGAALAEAYAHAIRNTRYANMLEASSPQTRLTHADATEYGTVGCFCPEALGHGRDLPLLRDAFFRFDVEGQNTSHARRRLTLAMLLDVVKQSRDTQLHVSLRPALYMGQYAAGYDYNPHPALLEWATRWRTIQIRQMYTVSLQALWSVFLHHLRHERSLEFNTFVEQVSTLLPPSLTTQPLSDYLDQLTMDVGLGADWQQNSQEFGQVCRIESGVDEISLYERLISVDFDPALVLSLALQILSQLFLRHYS